jgi:hypothetical protein
VPNSFEENVCENANTLAHVVDHMMVLAHLRRRWSLSDREGLGPSLPPAELVRRDSGIFEELKRLFSTTPEVRKKTEANEGHQGDRTLNRTCSVSSTQQSGAWVLGFATSASGPSWNRSVQSGTQRSRAWRRADRMRDAFGHTRSDASGRDGSSLDHDRTLALSRPVVAWSASGRCIACAGYAIGASGRLRLTVGAQ